MLFSYIRQRWLSLFPYVCNYEWSICLNLTPLAWFLPLCLGLDVHSEWHGNGSLVEIVARIKLETKKSDVSMSIEKRHYHFGLLIYTHSASAFVLCWFRCFYCCFDFELIISVCWKTFANWVVIYRCHHIYNSKKGGDLET